MAFQLTKAFEQKKSETRARLFAKIAMLSDLALQADSIEAKLLAWFTMKTPSLKRDQATIDIATENAIAFDVPKGFNPGEPVYVVWYAVPIEGNFELFEHIFQKYPWNSRLYPDQGKLWVKTESAAPVIGNTVLLGQIEQRTKVRLDKLDMLLASFRELADSYNGGELPALIHQLRLTEIQTRTNKKAALDQLQLDPV